MDYRVLQGDCRQSLAILPDQSVNCCVTSPPYFGLRDYGTAQWEGGSDDCDHKMSSDSPRSSRPLGKFHEGDDRFHETPYKHTCRKCGARRIDQQIGLEQTPDEYVAQMVAVFREVRRVLRSDGTLWLNLGDSYAGSGKGGQSEAKRSENWQPEYSNKGMRYGLKSKDLIGIPWRVAFALQADGWYLRQDIIWAKPNPMPESVKDRCTKSHEYIFLLSKSAKYFYDADAVMEQGVGRETYFGSTRYSKGSGRNDAGSYNADQCKVRNRRSVWTVSTKPYSEAHFATFPPDLIEPCILAGCPEDGTVLDPFGGSGTTAMVALKHRRNAILCELNPEYIELIHKRCAGVQPSLMQVAS